MPEDAEVPDDDAALAFGMWDEGPGNEAVADPDTVALAKTEKTKKKKKNKPEAEWQDEQWYEGGAADSANIADKEGDPQAADGGAVGEGEAADGAKKVKLKRSISDRIQQLNEQANLPAPIKLEKVAKALATLGEASALEVLDRMLEDREPDYDPSKWIKWAAKEKLAWDKWEAEQYELWEENQEKSAADRAGELPKEVLESIREINRSGILVEPLRMTWINGPLTLVSTEVALDILRILKSKASSTEVEKPNGLVRNLCLRRTTEVMARVESINKGGAGRMDLINPLVPTKVFEPLHMVPEQTAMKVLKELEARAMDIEDPTTWVIAACKKRCDPVGQRLLSYADGDMAKKLQGPVSAKVAWHALSRLDEKVALMLLGELERRAEIIRHPQGWLLAEAARRTSLLPAQGGKGAVQGKGPIVVQVQKGKVVAAAKVAGAAPAGAVVAPVGKNVLAAGSAAATGKGPKAKEVSDASAAPQKRKASAVSERGAKTLKVESKDEDDLVEDMHDAPIEGLPKTSDDVAPTGAQKEEDDLADVNAFDVGEVVATAGGGGDDGDDEYADGEE